MRKNKIKLIKKISELHELYSQKTCSYQSFEKRAGMGVDVWVKYYNGDEEQNHPFNLEVAESSPNSEKNVQTYVGNDGKTYKSVMGSLTIDGSNDMPDGQPTITLFISNEERTSYLVCRYLGKMDINRTVIYEDNGRNLTHDIIVNIDEILTELREFFHEAKTWWEDIFSKISEDVEIPQFLVPVDKGMQSTSEDYVSPVPHYHLPNLRLLNHYDDCDEPIIDKAEQLANKDKIVKVMNSFGIQIREIRATVGHTYTLYEVILDKGVRISKIRHLEDDIALSICAIGVRVIAPIPGRGTIGIEITNKHPNVVSMYSIIKSKTFQELKMELPLALGKTVNNEILMADLTKIPHLLIAGATGQGKSIGIHDIIISLLYKKRPDEMKLVLIDPKRVELNVYSPIAKHFLINKDNDDEVIITDVGKAVNMLNNLCALMDQRYDLLRMVNARNIKDYNHKIASHKLKRSTGHEYMPYIVVVIDEFGDLMMTAGKHFELPLARLAQLSRAVGIHLVIATQRPTYNIITGNIHANFPGRIAFKVAANIDSRLIIDRSGANQLNGRGDMIFLNGSNLIRTQCAYIDEKEVVRICEHIAQQPIPTAPFVLPEANNNENSYKNEIMQLEYSDLDPLFEEAANFFIQAQEASVSMLQRQFCIGFNRAGRLMYQLESAGIIDQAYHEVLIEDEEELKDIIEQLKAKGDLS